MKKSIAVILSCMLLAGMMSGMNAAYAAQTDKRCASSMQRLMDLGIFTLTAPDRMDLNRAATREELAIVLVLMNGKEDKVTLFRNTSLFPDVPATRASNGYVNAAVKLGYMSGLSDGRFHPADKITFAETARVIGKLLRYNEYNLAGSYPDNYLTLLENLGILEGISFSANGSVTRGQLALMLDRLFETKIFGGNQKYIETLSFYKSMIILENQAVNPKSDARRLLTETGVYYMASGVKMPDAGKKYIARIKDGQIVKLALADMTFAELSIKGMASGTAVLNNGERAGIPANPAYYYKGKPVDFDTVVNAAKANSSIIIGYDKDGARYGVLFDPVTSSPKVITASMAGVPLEVKYGGMLIDRAGKYITPSQIEVNDIVYEVTDIWKKNCYVIVHSNTVSGKVTAILPNKVSPKTVEIDGMAYSLSEDFQVDKLNGAGGIQVGDTTRVLLGSDGKAIDLIMDGQSENESYALVLNAYSLNSAKAEDFGAKYDYVTLLHTDGAKKTYRVKTSATQYRGRLITYEVLETGKDYDTVSLKQIDYSNYGTLQVRQQDRMLGHYYVASDVAIFNIINTNTPGDVQASIIRWSDLSDGYILDAGIKYLHTSGDFNDIDVLVADNILNENVKYGLVISKTRTFRPDMGASETVQMLINGQEYSFTGQETGAFLHSPVKVTVSGNQVLSVDCALTAAANGSEIQAVDSSRIRISNTVYTYHKNIAIYKVSGDNDWKKISPAELKKGDKGSITIYLDKPLQYGGRVVMITVR